MVDTDFYAFATCQSYSPDILSGDQTVTDNFGADATKWIQNMLQGLLSTVPTGGAVTDDQKAATNYRVVSWWKVHIKDYKAAEEWKKRSDVLMDSIKDKAKSDPSARFDEVVVESAYKTEPMIENEV